MGEEYAERHAAQLRVDRRQISADRRERHVHAFPHAERNAHSQPRAKRVGLIEQRLVEHLDSVQRAEVIDVEAVARDEMRMAMHDLLLEHLHDRQLDPRQLERRRRTVEEPDRAVALFDGIRERDFFVPRASAVAVERPAVKRATVRPVFFNS